MSINKILKIENLCKTFDGGVKAVNNVTLQVEKGEFLVLLGPSGCGKTTLLRMIAGLEDATSGKIFIDDKDVTLIPPYERDVGMVFQNYALWPHMTVYQNIAFPLQLKKKTKAEIETTINMVSKLVGIQDYLYRFPNQLSGGQQQRVAVARSVAYSPRIFLFDEPLSALDAKLRDVLRIELRQIHKETQATSIFVTHDQDEAMSLADRIVVMNKGEIMQIGTPEEIYQKSNSFFIADFIGRPSTNFFNSSIESGMDDEISFKNESFQFSLPTSQFDFLKSYENKNINIGIRPQDMIIHNEQSKNTICGEVLRVEHQGLYKIYYLKIKNRKLRVVSTEDKNLTQNSKVLFQFIPEKLMFFDKVTGEVIRSPEENR